MEGYKSMPAMRSYFNFPEPCINWGWLARKTQYWAGVSILGYRNTSSSFSSHFFQSLAFIINLCKVFRKQSWSENQTESLELCGMSCTVKPPVHWHKNTLPTCSLLCLTHHLGQDPKRQLGHPGSSRELVRAVSSGVCAPAHHLLPKTVMLL